MKRSTIVIIACSALAINILGSLAAPFYVGYLGFFPYKELLQESLLPAFLYSFANFDGAHYLIISTQGYLNGQHAFFPLYPLLIAGLQQIFPWHQLLSALLISKVAFICGLMVLGSFAQYLAPKNKAYVLWFLLFFIFFPTAFYLQGVYTESLFVLLFMGTILFLFKKQYHLAFLFALLTPLTRFVGFFLAVPIFFYFLDELAINGKKVRTLKDVPFKKLLQPRILLITIAPLLGFSLYCAYLLVTTGDPFRFFHALPDFNTGRSTDLITPLQVVYRYVKIIVTASWNFQYFIAVTELVVFSGVSIFLLIDAYSILKKRYHTYLFTRFGLNLYSWINILIPSLTGTLTSIPRYALTSFSLFIVLAQTKSPLIKGMMLALFGIVHILLLIFFIQGYFVS